VNISIISIVPIIGDATEELLLALSDEEGNTVHATVQEILFLANWISENVSDTEEEADEPAAPPARVTRAKASIDDLVVDHEDAPLRVMKSQRPSV
jgi:hypothetical protein